MTMSRFRKLLTSGFSPIFLLVYCNFYAAAQSGNSAYPADKQTINKGQNLFQQRCASCHNFKQQGIGPNLTGITTQVSSLWLSKFISNSQELVKAGDKRAVAVFNKYRVPMPANPDLTQDQIRSLLSFINIHKPTNAANAAADKTAASLGPAKVNPIPAKIKKSNLVLRLEAVTTAPPTADKAPLARINQMTVLKGQTERVFIQDLMGSLYEMKDTSLRVVFDMVRERPLFIHNPGHATGFGSYAFHPEFNSNGLFYTTHTEKPGEVKGDFTFPDSIPVTLQWVLTEWKIDDPSSDSFKGKPRELMRVNMPSQVHGVQQITFNPLAVRGSADYGFLYIGVGDGGSAESGYAYMCNSNTRVWSSVLRIDPRGNNSKNGRYGVPPSNPFQSDNNPATLGEIYVRGFRNPNRISWSPDGKMLISDIGLNNIEELNIGLAGADYGWPAREGTFLLNYKGKMNTVYALPPGKSKYVNPVIQYDHDEGNAFSAGFVYEGQIDMLKGKYIFGDIVRGRVFYVENADLVQGRQAPIKEFDLMFDNQLSDFLSVTNNAKADMRFGVGARNVLYIYTKTDGRIWQVKDCDKAAE
jgi:mono/diheme cytochrome c family protein